MKKVFEKLFGVEVRGTAAQIKGRKSQGVEDSFSYKNWRLIPFVGTATSIN